jgi:hypothetical protein
MPTSHITLLVSKLTLEMEFGAFGEAVQDHQDNVIYRINQK